MLRVVPPDEAEEGALIIDRRALGIAADPLAKQTVQHRVRTLLPRSEVPLSISEAIRWLRAGGAVQLLLSASPAIGSVDSSVPDRSFGALNDELPIRVIVLLAATFKGACPHLATDMSCGQYDVRPNTCRIYPAEIRPGRLIDPGTKQCPPEAWDGGGSPLIDQAGRLLDPIVTAAVASVNDGIAQDRPRMADFIASLGINRVALANEGFAVHTPERAILLDRLAHALHKPASTSSAQQYRFVTNRQSSQAMILEAGAAVDLVSRASGGDYEVTGGAPHGIHSRRWWRPVVRMLGIALLLICGTLVLALIGAWANLGKLPTGPALNRLQRSPHWHDGRFENAQPIWENLRAIWSRMIFGQSVPEVTPASPIPVVRPGRAHFARLPASGLRITWFGHSSTLIEIDGARVLIDPLWSNRPSPVTWAGPTRWYSPPVALADLPPIDAVLISHDHYDHLDRGTVLALKDTRARFIVPLGLGSHLSYWGIPRSRIVELDWWQSAQVGAVEVVATPARHASGRISLTSNQTLWAGFAMVGRRNRVWYSGDTGFHRDLAEIGRRYGPFNVTLIEAGQSDPLWPDNHLGPELAVEANRLVRGRTMIPVHWGLISLAPQGWTEPAERVVAAARCARTRLLVPRPGESVEPDRPPHFTRWWPSSHWQSADRKPLRPTVNGDPARRVPLTVCPN